MKRPLFAAATICFSVLLAALSSLRAEIPAVLTDKIHKGQGVINLLKDVTASQLTTYLNANKAMYLGVDLNEKASRPESARSSGVAIQEMRLLLTTSSGDFSFGDFMTSTTAVIRNSKGVSDSYYTMFGQTGSNQLTSSTSNFDISRFDDVITLNNISFTGDILSAKLEVKFLNTDSSRKAGTNEDFFDFSAGFEEFAIFTPKDAAMLEAAAIGQAAAPKGVTVENNPTPLNPANPPPTDGGVVDSGGGTTTPPDAGGGVVDSGGGATTPPDAGGGIPGGGVDVAPSAPGAPAPPLVLLFAGAGLLALYHYQGKAQSVRP